MVPGALPTPMRPSQAVIVALFCISPVLGQTAGGDPGEDTGSADRLKARHVTIETLVIDSRGTLSLGTDTADIFPGDTGVLEKRVTLQGRRGNSAQLESVDLLVKISPLAEDTPLCHLRIEAEARKARTGSGTRPASGDIRVALLPFDDTNRLFFEAFSSDLTGGRIALRVGCGSPPVTSILEARFIEFTVSIERADEATGVWEPLKTNLLRAIVGREASSFFSFNLPLDEDEEDGKRYRQERFNVRLSPAVQSGEHVQIDLSLEGGVSTVSARAPTVTHPISRRETLILKSGEPHTVEIEIPSSGPEEGWARVEYRLQVSSRF